MLNELAARNQIAPARRQPVDDGGMNALRAKLLMQQAAQQPAYVMPGEPPAKAFAPVLAQLGSMMAEKKATGIEADKQKRMADLLTNLVGGKNTIGDMPEGQMGPGQITNTPYSEQEKLMMLAQNPQTHGVALERLFQKSSDGFSLKPGEIRYDASGRQIATAPNEKVPEPFTLGPGQQRFGPDGKPIASVAKDTTPEKETGFKHAKDLRNEFINQSKDFKQISDSYGRIQAAGKNPSAAGDLALIFNYMKMLDPGSTVREGEFATAQNSAGIPERVRAMYNNVTTGERLTESTRSDFLGRSDSLYRSQEEGQAQIEGVYKGLSERYGLDPTNVVVDYRVKRPETPAAPIDPVEAELRRGGLLK